jgi:rhodanese-related sulfurtransferase
MVHAAAHLRIGRRSCHNRIMSLGWEIQPAEVKRLLETGAAVALIDVREEREHDLCSLDPAELIPMGQVAQRLGDIEALAEDKLVVVFCHHGMRSLNAVSWLRRQGVNNCQSMSGGIDAWSRTIDPSVPTY